MVFFENLFYPGNKEKEEEIRTIAAECHVALNSHKLAWNELADAVNEALKSKYPDLKMPTMSCDCMKNSFQDCLNEMQAVQEASKEMFDKLAKEIDPDFDIATFSSISLNDPSKALELAQKFWVATESVGVSVVAFRVARFVFRGLLETAEVVSTVCADTLIAGLLGAFAGAIAGAITFVITDAIGDAITGAIHRKQLSDALDALRPLHKSFVVPLETATSHISGTTLIIRNGTGYVQLTSDIAIINGQAQHIDPPTQLPHGAMRVLEAGPNHFLETVSHGNKVRMSLDPDGSLQVKEYVSPSQFNPWFSSPVPKGKSGPFELNFQDNNNLVITDLFKTVVWETKTGGQGAPGTGVLSYDYVNGLKITAGGNILWKSGIFG